MRKTFKFFCAVAVALLAVSSCGKIWDEFDNVHGEIDGLKERIEKLEKALQADVENLNTLQGKVNSLETSFAKAVADGDAAVKKALEDALAKVKADLEKAIADGDAANADALEAEVSKIESAIANLQKAMEDGLAGVTASVKNLSTALAALEATVGANYKDILAKMDAADKVLDGKIADVATAVEAVKKAYPAADKEVLAAFAEALAKVAVQKVEEVDGNVVLTLADGSKITLAKPLTNVDNSGLVTIVTEDGVKYWGVVKADGTSESLGIPVGADTSLEFRVGEGNALEYSLNGGEWIPTGAYVTDSEYYLLTDFYQGDTDEIDWETYEYVKEDFYTLVFGGEEYHLPLYKVDESVVTIKAGKTYFKYEESKTIDVTVVDVTAMYVMTKPDGWRAKLNGTKLTVTAPAEANVTSGVAESEGEVLLHCTTVDGKCKVAKLAVSTTEGITVSVDAVGNITVTNPILSQSRRYDPLDGWVMTYGFAPITIGLANVDEFAADPAGYVNKCAMGEMYDAIYAPDFDNFRNGCYVMGEDGKYTDDLKYPTTPYDPTTYPVDVCTFAMGDFYRYFAYEDMPKGQHFVVWAAPVDENGKVLIEDLVYVYYEPVLVEMKLVEASFSDITVNIEVSGAEKFLAGFIAESYFAQYGFTFDEFMSMSEGPFGQFVNIGGAGEQYKEYAEASMGLALENGSSSEYQVSALNYEGLGDVLVPGTKYYVWAMPILEGLSYADYNYETNFKPYVFEFETEPLEYSATTTAAVNVEYTVTPKTFTATVGAENTKMAYYMVLEGGVYEDWNTGETFDVNEMTDQEVADMIVANGTPRNEFPFTVYEQDLDPESSHSLLVLAVDENGCYGDPECVNITTAAVPYATDFSVEFKSYDAATGTATFDVTGNAQKVVCYHAYYQTYTTNVVDWLLSNGVDYYSFKKGDVVDGSATVKGFSGTNQWLIYVGYAEDETGNYTFTQPKVVNIAQ